MLKRYHGGGRDVKTRKSVTHWGKCNTLFLGGQDRIVYYESRKRDLKTRPIYECRCDERLQAKAEKSTRLAYTGLLGELEHLKIKTRLIDEMFAT